MSKCIECDAEIPGDADDERVVMLEDGDSFAHADPTECVVKLQATNADLREQYERLREAAKRMVAADEAITELCEQADCGWPDELEWSFNQLKVALSDAPTAPERRTEDS